MLVLGADTPKRSHALAGVDAGSGVIVGRRSISADEPGHLQALRWGRELDDERVWVIEDCRACLAAARALAGRGRRARGAGRATIEPGNLATASASPASPIRIDALAVARAVVREGIERFPAEPA